MKKRCKAAFLVMAQTLRMLLKSRQVRWIITLGLILLVCMLVGMDNVKEEKSRISIGVADEDNSELSKSVFKQLQELDLYLITVGEEKELAKALQKGELSAVCVLKEGFSEAVATGKTERLVTIYETKTHSAPLIGDILAGVMMQEICTAKSYQKLLAYKTKNLEEARITFPEYRSYVEKLLKEEGYDFSFDIQYLSPEQGQMEAPSQELVYEQAIFAVFALMAGLVSVYAVLPVRELKWGRLAGRVRTLPISKGALYLGSAAGAMIIPFLFGGMFLVCFVLKNEMEISRFFSLLICTFTYLCVIVCIMLVAACIIRSHTVYQMAMLAMILMFGIFGLVSLAEGLLVPEGMSVWVPNGWYVRRVTELLN